MKLFLASVKIILLVLHLSFSYEKYLLDSNICIHLLRNRTEVVEAVRQVGRKRCCISEMTVVELYYGAECSNNPEKNRIVIDSFLSDIEIVPFSLCIHEFCKQKARLCSLGTLIEDFDLFIGSAAIAADCILVTENVKYLSRLENIMLENWITR